MRGPFQKVSTQVARPGSMPAERLATPGQDHWFDAFTKRLATSPGTRRHFLELGVAGGLLASWASLLRIPMASAQTPVETRKFPPPVPNKMAPCTQTNVGGKRTTTLSASSNYKGQLLTLTSISTLFGRRTAFGTFSQRVELGGKLLYELTYNSVQALERASPGGISPTATPLGRLEISYAPPIRGPRHVILKVDNKGVVQGFADGHAVTKEHPIVVAIDPDLQKSMQDLFAGARRNLDQCGAGARNELVSDACQQCHYHCDIKVVACDITAIGGAVANPVSLTGLVGCAYEYSTCENDCNQQGGPCCSVQCAGWCCGSGQFCCSGPQNSSPTCCDNGSVCVSGESSGIYTYAYCCPAGSDPAGCQTGGEGGELIAEYCRKPGQICCGFTACDPGQCADPNWGLCCPTGQSVCAGSCCDGNCITVDAGTPAERQECCPKPNLVCGGGCCPAEGNQCCGDNCCPVGNCQPGNICCPPGQPICNGTCCAGGKCDAKGNCCAPPSHLCGESNICCTPFNICCGGACCEFNQTCVNGKCATATCPLGQVPCPDTPGMCCPPNLQCCPQTRTCCDRTKTECCGARGCVPLGSCTQ
jgi:hypothetical protein